jgi:hypothetical protein
MQIPWLPPELTGVPFGVADARDSGMPRWRLRDRALHVPTRSVRSVGVPSTPVERAAAFRVALPDDAVFSHVTACQLWRVSLPRQLEAQRDLDVMRATSRAQVRRSGCIGHRGLELRETATASGLRVTGLADTWVDLGEVAARGLTLDDLVVPPTTGCPVPAANTWARPSQGASGLAASRFSSRHWVSSVPRCDRPWRRGHD